MSGSSSGSWPDVSFGAAWSVRRVAVHSTRLGSPPMGSGSSKKRKKNAKQRKPLPKVGTPADNHYRLRRSQENLMDFGLGEGQRSPLGRILVGLLVLAVVIAVFVLVLV